MIKAQLDQTGKASKLISNNRETAHSGLQGLWVCVVYRVTVEVKPGPDARKKRHCLRQRRQWRHKAKSAPYHRAHISRSLPSRAHRAPAGPPYTCDQPLLKPGEICGLANAFKRGALLTPRIAAGQRNTRATAGSRPCRRPAARRGRASGRRGRGRAADAVKTGRNKRHCLKQREGQTAMKGMALRDAGRQWKRKG